MATATAASPAAHSTGLLAVPVTVSPTISAPTPKPSRPKTPPEAPTTSEHRSSIAEESADPAEQAKSQAKKILRQPKPDSSGRPRESVAAAFPATCAKETWRSQERGAVLHAARAREEAEEEAEEAGSPPLPLPLPLLLLPLPEVQVLAAPQAARKSASKVHGSPPKHHEAFDFTILLFSPKTQGVRVEGPPKARGEEEELEEEDEEEE